MQRPEPSEYAAPYGTYIRLVPEGAILDVLRTQIVDTLDVLKAVSEDTSLVHHAPYTWSFRDVAGHLADTERVFAYRALRFARGDAQSLPGFDENTYAQQAQADRRLLTDLASEFETVRRSTLFLFASLDEDAWSRSGTASDHPITVRALAYAIAGHARHHTAILKQRLAAT